MKCVVAPPPGVVKKWSRNPWQSVQMVLRRCQQASQVSIFAYIPIRLIGGVREPFAQGDHSEPDQKLLPIKHNVKLATRKLTKHVEIEMTYL